MIEESDIVLMTLKSKAIIWGFFSPVCLSVLGNFHLYFVTHYIEAICVYLSLHSSNTHLNWKT